MATTISTAALNAKCDAVVDQVDLGSSEANGKLLIFTGTQPATPDDPPGSGDTLLAEIDLQDPAFDDADGGAAAALGGPFATTGLANGQAGWGRIVDKDGNGVIDGACSGQGGNGQIQLDNTNIAIGQTVTVNSITYTEPQSG